MPKASLSITCVNFEIAETIRRYRRTPKWDYRSFASASFSASMSGVHCVVLSHASGRLRLPDWNHSGCTIINAAFDPPFRLHDEV